MLSATPPRPLCRRSELVHDWKARLGYDAGEGVGRSQSVIVVRDDLGVLDIFANQFESKAETAHKICGLAHKWQIGDWMGPPTLRYQGLDGSGWGHPLFGEWMGPPTLRYQGNVDGPWNQVSRERHGGPLTLVEMVLRRNIHVHNRGIVDERYLERDGKGAPRYNLHNLKLGDVALIDDAYWKAATRRCDHCIDRLYKWASL